MRPGARIKAAADIIDAILNRHQPAGVALADWGKSHRFAGSGDRSAIGNLVYDALRRRKSLAHRMGDASPRALALAAAPTAFGMTAAEVTASADGSVHALSALTEAEQAALARDLGDDVAAHVRGDYPDWLDATFVGLFGARAAEEGIALTARAPVDIRVNTLKADRDKVLKALATHGAVETPLSPLGVRLAPPKGGARQANVEAETAHGKGWYEVQDEGSQIAAAMTCAAPRQQILDICAGSGGKTLSLAAAMQNTGQIYAYDDDKTRLRPIFERLKRAGARNVQVLSAGDRDALATLGDRFDCVLVDAPCTGTGTWRRRPDTKWRLKPESLGLRRMEQERAIDMAAAHVKPGGRLVYVTCSLLPEENGAQITRLLAARPEFSILPWRTVWQQAFGSAPSITSADGRDDTLLLTPARHGTDGFFIAVLQRAP